MMQVYLKLRKGYPAISNTWYMYDRSNRLVLKDQELTVKPLTVTKLLPVTYYNKLIIILDIYLIIHLS
jgi:hypothetical protein